MFGINNQCSFLILEVSKQSAEVHFAAAHIEIGVMSQLKESPVTCPSKVESATHNVKQNIIDQCAGF